jgi:hypothetical protein
MPLQLVILISEFSTLHLLRVIHILRHNSHLGDMHSVFAHVQGTIGVLTQDFNS